MNIKEQESQVSVNLNLRIVVNIIAYLGLAGFMGYRLYLVSRLTTPLVSGVVVPRLKTSNFELLSLPPKATESGVKTVPVSAKEPFD